MEDDRNSPLGSEFSDVQSEMPQMVKDDKVHSMEKEIQQLRMGNSNETTPPGNSTEKDVEDVEKMAARINAALQQQIGKWEDKLKKKELEIGQLQEKNGNLEKQLAQKAHQQLDGKIQQEMQEKVARDVIIAENTVLTDNVRMEFDQTIKMPFMSFLSHFGRESYVNVVTISPDGSLCASGGQDGSVMLWDMSKANQISPHLYTFRGNGDEGITALSFSPKRFWLCAAAMGGVMKIWDLESKAIVEEMRFDVKVATAKGGWWNSSTGIGTECKSLVWSADGQTLLAVYTDNTIRVWRSMKIP